jgi:beta-lactamase class A
MPVKGVGLAGIVVALAVMCGGCATTQTLSTTASRHARSPVAHATAAAISPAQRLASSVSATVSADDDNVSVTAEDLTTGVTASYRGEQKYVTASTIKVDILAALLYQTHGDLTEQDQELATTMIENSDNDAATDLFDEVGAAAGLDAVNKVFGLDQTSVNEAWGLTTTDTDDWLSLLRQVFTAHSALTFAERRYIRTLMANVESDQQWGVPAAADSGTTFFVKNGWLPRSATDLWVINSIGEVTYHGQHLLIAVMSDNNETENSGISLVENLARKAAAAIAG